MTLHKTCLGLVLVALVSPVWAQSKLLATGGALQVEGQSGGGVVPWAVISGYGDVGEWGGTAAYTRVSVDDFQLDVTSASVGFNNRFELSYSLQVLDVQPLDLTIKQEVVGAKLRLAGDLVYGSWPQLSAGVQYKHNRDFDVPQALGADDNSGIDYYLAASRLWLDALAGHNVFANATIRWTDANQIGLLGFGADGRSDYSLEFETTLGVFMSRHLAVGIEYRQKPNRLSAVREQDWWDVWLGWFPNKRFTAVLAHSDLGDIAGLTDQSGWYLSIQVNQ